MNTIDELLPDVSKPVYSSILHTSTATMAPEAARMYVLFPVNHPIILS